LGNPHYHYTVKNILRISEGMADALSKLDPPNADFYRANLAAFQEKVHKKQAQWRAVPLKGKRFIAYHKYFEYLANDYGFQIVGYVEPKPGIPPSAGYLERLIETIRQTKPDGILTTPYYGSREEEFLAQKTGIKVIVVPHDVGATAGAKDWFSLMDQVLSSLQ
jgi:zinc/manganese transport system substrate-binding protein